MTELELPSQNGDKPLTVFARFRSNTTDDAVLALVRDYVKAWIRANGTWIRIWRSDVITEERMDFSSEFFSEPRVEVRQEKSSFYIVMEVRPHATRWKDWAVFLVSDITKIFHEVQFDRFES